MMEPNRDQMRAWLREVLEKMKVTPTALAGRAGLAQSTLTRFLNTDTAPILGTRSLAKIAHVANVQPFGYTTNGETLARAEGLQEPDATPYATEPNSAAAALLKGMNAADPWELRTTALEDAGYLPGDIVIVDLNAQAKEGDVVCAQHYRWTEGRAETIFRIFEPPFLVAATRNPAFRKPLLVDNDRVVVKGVVRKMIRLTL